MGSEILKSVDVMTVDGFQGQEKDIIILSCVRSNTGRGLGFITDSRRMVIEYQPPLKFSLILKILERRPDTS
jgi:hypothetical protein